MPCRRVRYVRDSFTETLGFSDPVVAHESAFVAGRILWATSELLAKIPVLDAAPVECGRQGFAVELGIEAAIRR